MHRKDLNVTAEITSSFPTFSPRLPVSSDGSAVTYITSMINKYKIFKRSFRSVGNNVLMGQIVSATPLPPLAYFSDCKRQTIFVPLQLITPWMC